MAVTAPLAPPTLVSLTRTGLDLALVASATSARLLGHAAVALVSLDPHGGQGRARRNAWASMGEAHRGARDRAEADRAVAVAQASAAGHPAGSARRTPLAR